MIERLSVPLGMKVQSSHISVIGTDLPAADARFLMSVAQYSPHAGSAAVSLSMQYRTWSYFSE